MRNKIGMGLRRFNLRLFKLISEMLKPEPLMAQPPPGVITVATPPSGSCSMTGSPLQRAVSNGHLYSCVGGTWTDITGSSTIAPAGSDKQIQLNENGVLSAESLFVYDYTNTRLGVGTSLPQGKIHVSDPSMANTAGSIRLDGNYQNPGDYLVLGFGAGGSTPISGIRGRLAVVGQMAFDFILQAANSQSLATGVLVMTVNGNGFVGIGNSAPSYALDVTGQARFTTGIVQPTFTALPLQNGWANFGVPYNNAEYMKDSLGMVHLRGMVSGGTQTASTNVAAVPQGPVANGNLIFSCMGSAGAVDMRVNGAGGVFIGTTTTSTWISLSNISFFVGF